MHLAASGNVGSLPALAAPSTELRLADEAALRIAQERGQAFDRLYGYWGANWESKLNVCYSEIHILKIKICSPTEAYRGNLRSRGAIPYRGTALQRSCFRC